MPHISERELQLPELEFISISNKIASDKNIISLGPGEPDFNIAKPLINYAMKAIKNSNRYTDNQGSFELREAITRKLKKENKINTSPEEVLVTCGSQEAIFSALLATIDPTEQVIIQSPGYVGYLPAIELVNGVPVFLELKEDENFEINPDRLKKIINKRKTKVMILNSPSNPTGYVASKKILEEIADIAVDNKIHIFSDEAYEKITYSKKHISIGSLNGMQDYVTTFQTFSKSFAMCGFRLGYAVGSKKLINSMNKVHSYITLSAPRISQMIGLEALKMPKKYTDAMVLEYKRRRNFIVSGLNDMGLYTKNPDGAFYAFANIGKYKNSSKFSKMLLDKAKVAVIPGTEFGPAGEGYVRLSFATEYKLIDKALKRIKECINE